MLPMKSSMARNLLHPHSMVLVRFAAFPLLLTSVVLVRQIYNTRGHMSTYSDTREKVYTLIIKKSELT